VAVEDRLLGALGFTLPSSRFLTADDRELIVALGRQCGLALERARLYEAEQRFRAEAEVARRDAEEASRAKSDFLAIMSHELRTPLNAILGYEDLLDGEFAGTLNETQHQYLGRVRSAAKQLLGLIDQILSLSRIEAGKEELWLQPVDLAEHVTEIAALVEPLAAKKQLRFRLGVPPDRVVMHTDPGKLRQVLLNLLSNAVKFTDAGECELSVALDRDEVVLTVRDTGLGIAPEDLERVFDPFTQVGSSAGRVAGGSGLGLSVSRRLTELLGGTIAVESVVGEGSTFVVRLPRVAPAEPTDAF
jgi:signal transduction histidine kinase